MSMLSEQRQRERSLYVCRKDEEICSLMEENMCDATHAPSERLLRLYKAWV